MKRPAVFFDRDNTLIANDGYLGDPSKVVLVEGAAEAVARARGLGYATVTFSNQSGVARGMFEEEDVHRVNTRMDALLTADNPEAKIERHEFCPFHPDGIIDVYKRETDRRKPGPGMILSAAEKLALDLSRSWVIGDALRDAQAGRAAGCRTILFRAPGLPASPDAGAEGEADFTVNSLKEALDVIEKNPQLEEKPESPEEPAEVQTPFAGVQPADAPEAHPSPAPEAQPAPAAAEAPKPDKPWLIAAQQARARRAALASGGEAPDPTASPAEPARAAEPTPAPADFPTAPIAAPKQRPPAVSPPAPEPLDYRSPGSDPLPPRSSRPTEPLPEMTRLESLAEQILQELRRHREHDQTEFSVTKLLAGIVQMIALAAMFLAYVRGQGNSLQVYLLVGIFLQTLTIALLIMTRQR